MQFVDLLCHTDNLTVMNSEARYHSETRKWNVVVQNKTTSEVLKLDLFQDLRSNENRVRQKMLLKGPHYLKYENYLVTKAVHCFSHKMAPSVLQVLAEKNLVRVAQREMFLHEVVRIILLVIRDLMSKGLCHQRLSWDNVVIHKDSRPKVAALEYVVPIDQVILSKLALVRHLPPEALKVWNRPTPDLEKVQIWILGSRLLEILICKYISGKTYQKPTRDLSHRDAIRNIKMNIPYLASVLYTTTLTAETQKVLQRMLQVDPDQRLTVDEALSYYVAAGFPPPPDETRHPGNSPQHYRGHQQCCTSEEAHSHVPQSAQQYAPQCCP